MDKGREYPRGNHNGGSVPDCPELIESRWQGKYDNGRKQSVYGDFILWRLWGTNDQANEPL